MAIKVRKLSKKLAKRDETITSLQEETTKLKQQMKGEESQKAELDAKLRRSKEELLQVQSELDVARQESNQKDFEIQLLKSDRSQEMASGDFLLLNKELESMREQLYQLKNDKVRLESEVDMTQQVESKWKETVDKMRKEIDQMNGKISEETQKNRMENMELEAKDASHKVEIKLLLNQKKQLEQEKKKLIDETCSKETLISEVEDSKLSLMNQIATLKKDLSDKQYLIKRTQKENDEQHALLEKLQERLQMTSLTHMKALEALNHRIGEVSSQRDQIISQYEDQIEVFRNMIYESKLSKLTNTKQAENETELATKLAQKDAQVKQLKSELKRLSQIPSKGKKLSKQAKEVK